MLVFDFAKKAKVMKFSVFFFVLILFSPLSVFADYSSYHESRTGEVACGGEYSSYHESRTGKVCAGGERK
jgi:hypothetical protein